MKQTRKRGGMGWTPKQLAVLANRWSLKSCNKRFPDERFKRYRCELDNVRDMSDAYFGDPDELFKDGTEKQNADRTAKYERYVAKLKKKTHIKHHYDNRDDYLRAKRYVPNIIYQNPKQADKTSRNPIILQPSILDPVSSIPHSVRPNHNRATPSYVGDISDID